MKIFTIPNFITLGNLLCGILGIKACLLGELETCSYYIIAAMIVDFFDGFVARLLGSSSEIGKELDSLADVVSFGVLPALMIERMLSEQHFQYPQMALLLALASALRLAKFNIDIRQSDKFIGLPTPPNAAIIASFPFIMQDSALGQSIISDYFLVIYVLVFSFLLNAELPLIALKFKDYTLKNNLSKYILMAVSLTLLLFLQIMAIPFIVLVYIGMSVYENMKATRSPK